MLLPGSSLFLQQYSRHVARGCPCHGPAHVGGLARRIVHVAVVRTHTAGLYHPVRHGGDTEVPDQPYEHEHQIDGRRSVRGEDAQGIPDHFHLALQHQRLYPGEHHPEQVGDGQPEIYADITGQPLDERVLETVEDRYRESEGAQHGEDDERTQTTVSRENYDIYRMLTVMRNGYMNVHEKPFTYFDTLLPVARKLEQVTQVKNAAAFNADDFRIYSSVLSRQAEAILQRNFDVRGHRSIVNELDDGNLAFTVGRVKLNSVQRAVLHDGHAVHLPENDSPENRRQAYCMADRFENRLVTSARPFPGVRTYRMTSDGLIRPVDPEPDGKAKKRETKSKSNKPKI